MEPKYNDEVVITSGFYRGLEGILVGYNSTNKLYQIYYRESSKEIWAYITRDEFAIKDHPVYDDSDDIIPIEDIPF